VIELSTLSGGNRLVAVTLKNYSSEPQTVDFRSEALHSMKDPDWLIVRPKEITIPPGRERKVMVSMRSTQSSPGNRYATLSAGISQGRITIASITAEGSGLLRHEEPTWVIQDGRHSIQLPIKNQGDAHSVIDATLRIVGISGRNQNIDQSWGRWVMPQETVKLHFPMRGLPAGQYRLVFEVEDRRSGSRLELERGLEVPLDVE